MSYEAWLVVLMFVSMVIGIFSGAHIAFVLGSISIVFGVLGWGMDCFNIFGLRVWGVMNNFTLVAIPAFVFMGYILEGAGLAEDLYASMEKVFSRVRGGLAIGTIIFATLIAACTGIVASGVIISGLLALPPMFKRGYDKGMAMGAVAAGGTLGILIPPSIMLIFYAGETGLSAGRLFAAAFGPGLLLASLYILYVVVRCIINPSLAPQPQRDEMDKLTFGDWWRMFKGLCPVVGLILAVLGAIISGMATPTEAAATGALGAICVAAIYRQLSVKLLWESSMRTVQTTGMIMLLIITAGCFASVFTGLGGDELVLEVIDSMGIGQTGVIILCLSIIAIFGLFIDWAGILYICLPIFIPLVLEYDINPLWFALLVCTTMQTAWLTPPFGFSIFFVKSVVPPEIQYAEIVKGCLPYFGMQILGIALCIIFPDIILWMPKALGL